MVTEEQRLRARLRLTALDLLEAAEALRQVGEIPRLQDEITRRLRRASDVAYMLERTVQEQRRDFPDQEDV